MESNIYIATIERTPEKIEKFFTSKCTNKFNNLVPSVKCTQITKDTWEVKYTYPDWDFIAIRLLTFISLEYIKIESVDEYIRK